MFLPDFPLPYIKTRYNCKVSFMSDVRYDPAIVPATHLFLIMGPWVKELSWYGLVMTH